MIFQSSLLMNFFSVNTYFPNDRWAYHLSPFPRKISKMLKHDSYAPFVLIHRFVSEGEFNANGLLECWSTVARRRAIPLRWMSRTFWLTSRGHDRGVARENHNSESQAVPLCLALNHRKSPSTHFWESPAKMVPLSVRNS